jgi:hypothetical protein
MPENVQRVIAAWAAPALLAALIAVCGILWMDMRSTVEELSDKLGKLNDAVVRLTTLQEGR